MRTLPHVIDRLHPLVWRPPRQVLGCQPLAPPEGQACRVNTTACSSLGSGSQCQALWCGPRVGGGNGGAGGEQECAWDSSLTREPADSEASASRRADERGVLADGALCTSGGDLGRGCADVHFGQSAPSIGWAEAKKAELGAALGSGKTYAKSFVLSRCRGVPQRRIERKSDNCLGEGLIEAVAILGLWWRRRRSCSLLSSP